MSAQRLLEKPFILPPRTARAAGRRSRRVGIALLAAIVLLMLAYFALVRPWHLRWGATDAEVAGALPGDAWVPAGALVSTRAITVLAPPEKIWPWVVQLGQGRGGYYSYDWLENLFAADMRNADRIEPALQTLAVGDRITFQVNGPQTSVSLLEPNHVLVLQGWTFDLEPIDGQTTRFIVRSWFAPGGSAFEYLYNFGIFEPAHFVMESGMMMGIKTRAERYAGATLP